LRDYREESQEERLDKAPEEKGKVVGEGKKNSGRWAKPT
jgi:hypothetical protein